MYLGNLVNEVAEYDLLDWFGRVKLMNCICDFVSLNPQIGQVITCMHEYCDSLLLIWTLIEKRHELVRDDLANLLKNLCLLLLYMTNNSSNLSDFFLFIARV